MPTLDALGPIMEEARLATVDPATGKPMTQVQLAELLGISRWTYNRVVNGHAQLRTEWVRLLPLPIREPVVRYLQRRHEQQRDVLNDWLHEPAPRRIRRPTASGVAAVV